MSMTEKIIDIIRNEMDVFMDEDTEITADMNLASDLNVDSLDMVLVVETIENEFNVNISNEDLYKIRTVNDLENKIKALQAVK